MYAKFVDVIQQTGAGSIVDVGVTADQSYESSNYLEAWYPEKSSIMAVGIDDAEFLESKYPGVKFTQANGLDMPFDDRSFDYVHSSAVLEHVGCEENQLQFIRESARLADKAIFLTTPNRWFPVEFHTVLPLLHWLPMSVFRFILNKLGMEFFAREENLNLLGKSQLVKLSQQVEGFEFSVQHVSLVGWPSNLLLVGRRIK